MSREGDQVREGPGKDLQPEPPSDRGALSPQHVLVYAAACGDERPRIPAPGRPCSTENPTLLKMNQENLADDGPLSLIHTPGVWGWRRRMGRMGEWLYLCSVDGLTSHTPGGDLHFCPH